MKKNIKFSIIVVSLNTKNDFLKTVNSILSQEYRNFEIIVVDGKSQDGTIKEIKKRKKFFKKIIIEQDKGIYDAMNKGVKYIKKDWVIFLNSGDIFYNSKTLKKTNLIIKKNTMSDLIVGRNIINYKFKYLSNFDKINKNTFGSVFSHQSVFFKSKLFLKKKFDIKFKIAADFEMFKYLIKKNKKYFYSNEVFSISKIAGLSDKNRFLALKEFFLIGKKYNSKNISILTIKFFINYMFLLIKTIIKFFLPNYLNLLMLKIKYRNNIL